MEEQYTKGDDIYYGIWKSNTEAGNDAEPINTWVQRKLTLSHRTLVQ